MTIEEMFDYLKQYIDKKVNGLDDSIRNIFDEYGVKEVSENIDDVRSYGKTYLGSKSKEPITRNDGEPLQVGDLYFDENLKVMKAYDGEKWQITQQYSNEDILNKLKNVDGQGSGLDADLMRGKYISPYNFKNKIINGDMQVIQRGAAFNIKNDEEFTADRWVASTANDNEISVEIKTENYKRFLEVTLTAKATTYIVTPYEYRFEGQHIADILTAKDKATLSFEFASNVNRNYTIRLYYQDGTLYNSKTITYSGSGKFERYSVVFDFNNIDLTKVNLDENLGLVLTIAENDELNVGDYLRITNVQFEKDNVTTEFEVLPYEVQLDRCLRYYRYLLSDVRGYAGNYFITQHSFNPIMRISPALTKGLILDASNNVSTSNLYGVSKYAFRHEITPVNTNTDTYELQLEVFADAELPGRGE